MSLTVLNNHSIFCLVIPKWKFYQFGNFPYIWPFLQKDISFNLYYSEFNTYKKFKLHYTEFNIYRKLDIKMKVFTEFLFLFSLYIPLYNKNTIKWSFLFTRWIYMVLYYYLHHLIYTKWKYTLECNDNLYHIPLYPSTIYIYIYIYNIKIYYINVHIFLVKIFT